jgi:hypothetical protein
MHMMLALQTDGKAPEVVTAWYSTDILTAADRDLNRAHASSRSEHLAN